jgi:hypothetical protein
VRRVRIVRDYGKYDRREAPQYYADAKGGETLHAAFAQARAVEEPRSISRGGSDDTRATLTRSSTTVARSDGTAMRPDLKGKHDDEFERRWRSPPTGCGGRRP